MLPRSHTKWSVGFLFFQVATQTLKHVRNIWLALIYSLIASVFLCDSRLAVNTPCEVCGFDHNKTWKSSECSLEKQARTLKGKKLSWLQISLFLVVIAYLKKKSWWINGNEYDGPLPRVLGLGLRDDTLCCLQHSFQTIWYVVLYLGPWCRFTCIWKQTSPRSHSSACENLYFGTQNKKGSSGDEDTCHTCWRLNNDTDLTFSSVAMIHL